MQGLEIGGKISDGGGWGCSVKFAVVEEWRKVF
jgi:hypothetical protein